MRPLRFACLFVVFISTMLLAQSNTVSPIIQNGLSLAQEPHQEMPTGLPSRIRAGFGQQNNMAGAMKHRPDTPQSLGLNFAPAVGYGSGAYNPLSVAVADLNGDGNPDLVVANVCADNTCTTDGVVGVLLGNGDGTFQPVVTYSSGGAYASTVVVADVNGDGKSDLIVANQVANSSGSGSNPEDGMIAILLGNGDGTFQNAVLYDVGGYFGYSVAVADVNGDGKLDLVATIQCGSNPCSDNSEVGVLLGNGDGTFQEAKTYGSGGYAALSVVVADVNGDGKPDIVVSNQCLDSCSGGGAGVLLGNGDGTFQTAVTYSSGGNADSVVVADVNGDGKPDLLMGNYCVSSNCTVVVLLGNGNGTFQPLVTYGSGGDAQPSVRVADVNGDGTPDIVVASQCINNDCSGDGGSGTVGVLLGNGDGTFQPVVAYGSGGFGAYSVAVADLNKDGKPDVVVANGCVSSNSCANGTVGVLLNVSGPTPTTTAVTSSSNPSVFGQPVTFTSTVTAQGSDIPTGTVTFYDGTTSIGTSNLNNSGVAPLTTSNLSEGTHSITTTYNGNANFAPSTSPVLYQVVQGAIVSLSPASLNFGNQTVGIASASQIVTLTNTGNATLTITSIAVSLSSGSYAQTNTCGTSVLAGTSCTVSLSWTPSVAGNMTGSITFTDSAPGSPQIVSLSGIGVQASTMTALVSTPNPSNFGQSVTFTATVKPQGLGIPTGTVGFFDGAKSLGSSALNSSGAATLTTTNLAVGTHSITASYGGNPNFAASVSPVLSQVVQGAIVYLSTIKLNFGNQTVGITSTPQTVTLTNTGNIALAINSLGINSGDFLQTNTCGSSVATGASCTISVTFAPTTLGVRNAAVTITDNGAKGSASISLLGTGVLPTVSLSPSSLTFPTQVVFTTSASKTVTLTNTGLGTLKLSKIAVTGPFAQTNTCGSTLNASGSCTFTVMFKPTTDGSLTGSITLTDNAANSPQTVTLKGTGTYVQLTPTSENFGNQPVGTTSLPKKITLSNKGSVAVSITSISITGTDAGDFAQTDTCGSSVAAGASCFIKVTFTPKATGTRSASVSVSDNGGGSPQSVALSGAGT
jgi:hypothetical protein